MKPPTHCDCPETHIVTEHPDGRIEKRELQMPAFRDARHDCAYTRRRNDCVIQAEAHANATVNPDTDPRNWTRAFSAKMKELAG
jgi:hypothetical protein